MTKSRPFYFSLIAVLLFTITATFAQERPLSAGPHVNGQNAANWTVVPALSDEFNGNSLNTNKWNYGHPFWIGRPPAKFGQGGNAYVQNGTLIFRPTWGSSQPGYNMECGAIYNKGGLLFKKGYYTECHFRANSLKMGTGFWVLNNDKDSNNRADEIDIHEAFGVGNLNNKHNTNVHNPQPNFTNDQPQPLSTVIPNGQTVSNSYHTYGLWWVSDRVIRFYLDGVLQRELTTNSTLQDMWLVINSETYNFLGAPTQAEVENHSIRYSYIRYVRTWRPSGNSGGGGNPPPGGGGGGGGCNWTQQQGAAVDVGARGNNVYVIGTDGYPYKSNGNGGWLGVNFSKKIKRLDVSANGEIWAIGMDNRLWQYQNNQWLDKGGSCLDVGVNDNNGIWVIGTDNRIYRYTGGGNFSAISSGAAKKVDVDSNNRPWVVGFDNILYQWNGSTWLWKGNTPVQDVGVNPTGGSVVVTATDTKIYQVVAANNFRQISGGAVSVTVNSNNVPWVVSGGNTIYKRNCAANQRVGVEDLEEKQISQATVYPNPLSFGETLKLELLINNPGDIHIDVYSSNGARVYSRSLGSHGIGQKTFELTTDELNVKSTGIYLLKINSGGVVENKRILITN